MPPSSPRRLSLQQIVESRRRAAFVGREAELGLFRVNFTLPPEDPRHRFVFHVRGNAGVGKTSLLREWRQAAGEFGALTASADESADSVPDVLAAFAEQFAEQGHPLKALDRLLATYRRALREAAGRLAADNEGAGPSAGALAAAQAGLIAAGAIPVVGALAGGIDPAVVARGAGGLRAVFGGRARQVEEARLLAEPVQILTPVFVAELDRVADAVPWVALFLDTYERTAPQLDRWLADLLTPGRYGELPANLVLTLAGQRRLDPAHWGDRGRLVADVPLGPFTEAESRQLLHERGVVSEPVVREVLRLSGGLPVLVSTLAANPGAAGEANATAVERFLAGESDPARRAAALACALPRRFDEDLVAVAVPPDGPHAVPGLYDWLLELPFVAEPYSGRSRYHAVVRAPMLRLQRTGSPRRWKAAHDRLAEAFAARRDAAAEGIDPERLWAEQPWRRAALDVLYHRLCARPRIALPEALRAGIELFAQRPSRARHWARTLVDAGEDADNAVLREWGRDLLAAITDHGPRPTAALGLLLTRAELTDTDRAAALVARAWDRFRAGELDAALSDHGRAIAVDPRSERAHQGRAVILRSLGRYEEALADLDRAEEIAPAWAWAVRERGETYRRMGRLEEALTVLDRAHAMDPSDAVPLGSRGLVRHVLGRPEDALDDFDRAIALWPEYAWALVRRSRVRTVLGDPVGALADLDRAEELNPGLPGTEGERGEVYRATGRYEEAVACYDRALALDPDYAWAHGSRAAALEALGRIPEARADLDRALELDPGYAWARERRGRLGPAGVPPAGVPSAD